ncbi:membrane integrity-associated transporter subunit PqiC [Motilimonas sp. KMU-193]|uniref:PqiC family protein n=1 Tax=Motilimonas sp. KMU-193 TaxID=3388668 RepID=UPI00396B4564
MNLIKPLLLSGLSLTLLACSQTTSIPSQYYALGADDLAMTVVDSNTTATLVLKPVELPDYLNSTGVVMQLNDNQVHIAEQHLWAGSLNQQLDNLALESMTLQFPRATVVESAQFYPEAGAQYWILSVSVNRFQGRLEGTAVSSGRWQLIDPDGKLVRDELFNYQLPVITKDYPEVIEKLKENWIKFNQSVALQVRQAIQQRENR